MPCHAVFTDCYYFYVYEKCGHRSTSTKEKLTKNDIRFLDLAKASLSRI